MCVEPIDFKTGAIFLSAPAKAAFYVEKVHARSSTIPRYNVWNIGVHPVREGRCCPLLAIQSLHTWWAHGLEVNVPNVAMFHECPTQPRRAFRGCNRGSCLPFEALSRLHRNLERPRRMFFPYSRPAPTRRWNQGPVHPDQKVADHHRSVRE